MDHHTTIPSQLSPDTIPSVLAPEADAAGGTRHADARSASGSLWGRLAFALVLGVVVVVITRLA